jgi:hypothetical protein
LRKAAPIVCRGFHPEFHGGRTAFYAKINAAAELVARFLNARATQHAMDQAGTPREILRLIG